MQARTGCRQVVVGKTSQDRTETVRDKVRRTDVEIERSGGEEARHERASIIGSNKHDASSHHLNLFSIAAENVGYAKSSLRKRLPAGIKMSGRDLSSARFGLRRGEGVFPNRQLIHGREAVTTSYQCSA